MYIYLETKNLLVHSYSFTDLNGLYDIMSNPQVHHYTKDKDNAWDKVRTEQYIQFFIDKDFKTLDCFHGAIIEKRCNKIIGLIGMNPYMENEPEIEWKLGVSYWNKGYATEIGKELIKKAFETTNIIGIYGISEIENYASRRVLEKIGMEYLGLKEFRGKMDTFYYIKRY